MRHKRVARPGARVAPGQAWRVSRRVCFDSAINVELYPNTDCLGAAPCVSGCVTAGRQERGTPGGRQSGLGFGNQVFTFGLKRSAQIATGRVNIYIPAGRAKQALDRSKSQQTRRALTHWQGPARHAAVVHLAQSFTLTENWNRCVMINIMLNCCRNFCSFRQIGDKDAVLAALFLRGTTAQNGVFHNKIKAVRAYLGFRALSIVLCEKNFAQIDPFSENFFMQHNIRGFLHQMCQPGLRLQHSQE